MKNTDAAPGRILHPRKPESGTSRSLPRHRGPGCWAQGVAGLGRRSGTRARCLCQRSRQHSHTIVTEPRRDSLPAGVAGLAKSGVGPRVYRLARPGLNPSVHPVRAASKSAALSAALRGPAAPPSPCGWSARRQRRARSWGGQAPASPRQPRGWWGHPCIARRAREKEQ